MSRHARTHVLALALVVGMRLAHADDQGPQPAPGGEPAAPAPDHAGSGDPAAPVPTVPDPLEVRVRVLEEQNQALQDRLDALEEKHEVTKANVKRLLPLEGRLTGYLDIGFFVPSGNGSGIRADTNHRYFPKYEGVVPDSWVFMGDPLSTAVNARGEPADTGDSRAVVFDAINSRGKSSFIVNSANVALFAGFSESLQANASFDLVPRGRDVSDPSGIFVGDFIDVKLAYLEYRAPWDRVSLSVFAGKFDSTLGVEYRSQDAPDRLSVTPSLICRYTCGHPLGLKTRLLLFDDRFGITTAITNGSNFTSGFPFSDEIDSNQMKTGSARISYKLPLGISSEVGVSGAFGAQDLQPDDDVHQWHYGADARIDWNDIVASAEFVQGRANGKADPGDTACGVAPCLHYKGAYGLVGYRATTWLTPYVRVDWRNAVHESGAAFVYISRELRETTGVRFEIGANVVIKAEYTINHELSGIPQFANNMFTSALVVRI